MTVAVTKLTVSYAEILSTGDNLRHGTSFPDETTDVHVLMDIGTNTETKIDEYRMVCTRNVEVLRSVATILQVCSRRPACSLESRLRVQVFFLSFCFAPGTPH